MQVKVSVVVCTYNRAKYIRTCLEKLHHQKVDQDIYEVVIVNNNSTDNTEEICLSFINELNVSNFRYVNEKSQGHSYSRNRGIFESKGEIISFIDDDSFVYENFIQNIVDYFDNNQDVKAIGGKINPVFEGGKPKWMSKYLMPLVSALDMGSHVKEFEGRKFPIGANMSFRKSVFDHYGDFNVQLGRKGSGLEGGDEKEVFLRLKRANEKIMYVPSVEEDHIIPPKRVEQDYIKGLGVGVGTSERKRIRSEGKKELVKKVIEELVKSAGTLALFLIYALKGHLSAGWMLIRFRTWVLKGLIFGK